jgi:hypothetical protein
MTKEDWEIYREAASARFEDVVRQYIQALIPAGYAVTYGGSPECDLLIEIDNTFWIGEMKFSSLGRLTESDAHKAIDQLAIRRSLVPANKVVCLAIITNARKVPDFVMEWKRASIERSVFRATLSQDLDGFMRTLTGNIASIDVLGFGLQEDEKLSTAFFSSRSA